MKTKIAILFLTTAMALVAQDPTISPNAFAQPTSEFSLDAPKSDRTGTIYLKMGVNDSELPRNDERLLPGLGVGYRVAFGASAVDVSANGNRRDVRDAAGEKQINYSYTLPKVNYLYYISPASNQSFYAGGGFAWNGMKDATVVNGTTEVMEFQGIASNVVVGYEIGRKANFRTFFQLDASQPTVAAVREGKFPTPVVEFAIGAGF